MHCLAHNLYRNKQREKEVNGRSWWFEDEERGENVEDEKKTRKGDALTQWMHGVCKALEKEQRSKATQIKHKKKLYTYILKSVK